MGRGEDNPSVVRVVHRMLQPKGKEGTTCHGVGWGGHGLGWGGHGGGVTTHYGGGRWEDNPSVIPVIHHMVKLKQSAHAGIIRYYNVLFSFYIYKAIRKVLFFLKGLIVLFFILNETSMIKNWLPVHFIKTVSYEWFYF